MQLVVVDAPAYPKRDIAPVRERNRRTPAAYGGLIDCVVLSASVARGMRSSIYDKVAHSFGSPRVGPANKIAAAIRTEGPVGARLCVIPEIGVIPWQVDVRAGVFVTPTAIQVARGFGPALRARNSGQRGPEV